MKAELCPFGMSLVSDKRGAAGARTAMDLYDEVRGMQGWGSAGRS